MIETSRVHFEYTTTKLRQRLRQKQEQKGKRRVRPMRIRWQGLFDDVSRKFNCCFMLRRARELRGGCDGGPSAERAGYE